jgi:suppressor of ftsI
MTLTKSFIEACKSDNTSIVVDTLNVAPEGSVDLIMDFADPIISGMSVFHCHLLKHEDRGMMAKILFQ